jgi:hypothetical protein
VVGRQSVLEDSRLLRSWALIQFRNSLSANPTRPTLPRNTMALRPSTGMRRTISAMARMVLTFSWMRFGLGLFVK